MMNAIFEVYDDPQAVAEEAARRIVAMTVERPGERFSLALSGGTTPQRLHRLLSASPWKERIDWKRLHVFLADERFLPLDHPDSNFRMIRETLLDPLESPDLPEDAGRAKPGVPIGTTTLPAENLHPMPTDGEVEDCADRYEAELRAYFGDAPPRFDCILLGMGPDGHTASIFPGHVHPGNRWVLPIHGSPKPPPTRISLSLELINQARHVLFLVTGADKAEALASIRDKREPLLPAGHVDLADGQLVWLLDKAASAV